MISDKCSSISIIKGWYNCTLLSFPSATNWNDWVHDSFKIQDSIWHRIGKNYLPTERAELERSLETFHKIEILVAIIDTVEDNRRVSSSSFTNYFKISTLFHEKTFSYRPEGWNRCFYMIEGHNWNLLWVTNYLLRRRKPFLRILRMRIGKIASLKQ